MSSTPYPFSNHPLRPYEPEESHLTSMPAPLAEKESGGVQQLRRIWMAVLRKKWLILGTSCLGLLVGIVGTRFVKPAYVAQATLWIESPEGGNQGPIRTGELLRSSAWIELLRSYMVLDYVVAQRQLYLMPKNGRDREAFAHFRLRDRFAPGRYRLEVARDGQTFSVLRDGTPLEQKRVGEPVGEQFGFEWSPGPQVLTPGRILDFTLLQPRDASVRLARDLRIALSGGDNFMSLGLSDTDPQNASETLNTLAARFVEVSAQLKRAKLDELTAVLDEQRIYAEDNLRQAEMDLESYRVQTITLPSEGTMSVTPGLEVTRDPVLSRFFDFQVEREQLRSDREAVARVMREVSESALSLDALMMIYSVQQHAPAMVSALSERTTLQAEMRASLQRYTPDHPIVRDLQQRIQTLESRTLPELANELEMQLLDRERELEARIGSASTELRAIPPRAIEEARLKRQIAVAENLHTMLKQRFEEARLAAASTIPDIRVLDEAVTPSRPLNDPRPTVILFGFLGGLGLAIAGVVLVDRASPHLRYPEEITQGMGLAILGVVPHVQSSEGSRGKLLSAQASEAFREIRLNLVHAHGTAGPLVLTISSPGSGDGKSFVTSNLALAFADQGYRTLIIDGDTRRGALHRTLGTERVPGLTEYLTGSATEEEIVQSTRYPNVFLIAGGTRMPNSPELVSSAAMSRLLVNLKSHFGVILVDSPPLGAGADAYALGIHTRNLLLVVRAGTTDRALATMKLKMADRLPLRVLGSVLNGVSAELGNYRYYSYLEGYEALSELEYTDAPAQLEPA